MVEVFLLTLLAVRTLMRPRDWVHWNIAESLISSEGKDALKGKRNFQWSRRLCVEFAASQRH